jgi:hypothetical protein
MANLSEIFLKQETLETLLNTVKAKGLKGVSITISQNDDLKRMGSECKLLCISVQRGQRS